MVPDLVWLVRPGENEELRYSIRSIAQNAPEFGKIWIVGSPPDWATNVEKIKLKPKVAKFENIKQSVVNICKNDEVADNVVFIDDDMFLVEHVSEWVNYQMGTMQNYIDYLKKGGMTAAANGWLRYVIQTTVWMEEQGYKEIPCYETHTPVIFDRKKLSVAMAQYPTDRCMFYKQLFAIAGAGPSVESSNCKTTELTEESLEKKLQQDVHYLSSNDVSFANGAIGNYVREMFPNKCKYER